MKSSHLGIFIFALFTAIGAFTSVESWDGVVYIYTQDGEDRMPAAVKKSIDFSSLKGGALSFASQKRIIEQAKIIEAENQIGVELGHFVTRSVHGKKQLACKRFDTVSLKFIAVGVAENGEPSEMEVETNCLVGDSIGKIEPIWIPVQKLLEEKPSNMELRFHVPFKVTFRFDHIGSAWPKVWNLHTVTLKTERSGDQIHIDHQQMRQLAKRPLTIHWN